MATQAPKNVSNNIGALTNDFRPLFKIPAGYGGITVLEANYVSETAGTTLVQIVDLGTAGTAIAAAGTIFSSGTAVIVAGIPAEMSEADTAYVGDGHWVGVSEGNVGTTGVISIVELSFLYGK